MYNFLPLILLCISNVVICQLYFFPCLPQVTIIKPEFFYLFLFQQSVENSANVGNTWHSLHALADITGRFGSSF